jgi:mono/diheme cytochrome c family protein
MERRSRESELFDRIGACYRVITLLLFPIVFCGATLGAASRSKPWPSPRSCIFTRNPVNATPRSISAGRKIYMMRCVGCHGPQGNGDGPDAAQLAVRPARLSTAAVQEQTDGVLWWKITVGRRPMPEYAFRLSNEDRWNVINYLRTLRRD